MQMGSDHAKYLELLQENAGNALIRVLYRTFQGQKGHYSNLVTDVDTRRHGGQVFILDRSHEIISRRAAELSEVKGIGQKKKDKRRKINLSPR